MSDQVTPQQTEALKIAEELIEAGVPVFAAAPNPDQPGGYYLPRAWQLTAAGSRAALEQWRPGWGLGAVGGHTADFLDFDPRNGGLESGKELKLQGQMPRAYGVQRTPSGGTHLIITPTGERKATGFMPGVDLQAGAGQPDEHGGYGRGFVWIAPTVRPSKAPETLGQLRPYVWERHPDLDYLAEYSGADDTLDGVLARVAAHRIMKPRESALSAPTAGASQLFGALAWSGVAARDFTEAEAQTFCAPHLEALEQARIGEIEEHANRAAAALSHFVPAIWTPDFAFAVLSASLAVTDYDPSHPASTWTVEKFRPVLDGRRPPLDNWKAARKVTAAEAAGAFGAVAAGPVALPASPQEAQDMVDALLAEMLTPDQIGDQPAPRALIKGLLNLDSCAWVIGAPGSKKSFVVLDMAAHVVRGMPWQGLKVHQGPAVLIVAEGAGGMSNRIKAWQKTYGRIGDQMRILPRPVQVSDVAAWQVLVEACRRLEPVLVVIDTQARVTVGLEENSAKEMGVFVEAAERIRAATGACVMPVHHTGRAGGDARGSSALDGAQGTELKVVRQDGMTGVLKVEKQKDLEERPEMPLHFDRVVVGVDEDGEDVASLVLLEAGAFRDLAGRGEEAGPRVYVPTFHDKDLWKQRILDALWLHAPEGGMTKEELRARLEVDLGVTGLKRNGAFSGAWKHVIELEDSAGEKVVARPAGQRFELGSLLVRAGMEIKYPLDE